MGTVPLPGVAQVSTKKPFTLQYSTITKHATERHKTAPKKHKLNTTTKMITKRCATGAMIQFGHNGETKNMYIMQNDYRDAQNVNKHKLTTKKSKINNKETQSNH